MGLIAGDLKHLVYDIFEIDSFKSKMGDDKNIVVLSLSARTKESANDLMNFLEKGYPFVLDADVTSGEQADGSYKVFVELERNKDVGTRDYTGQQLNTEGGYRRYHWGKCSKGSYWDEREYYGDYVNWLDGGSTYILSRRAMISINKTYKMEDSEGVSQQ